MSGLLAALDSRTRSRPFPLLVRLFVSRVFRGSGTSEGGELDLSIGLILALLALPGAFYSLLLLEKYSTLLQWMHGQKELDPLAGALPDEYFFIVLSMVVTGVVAVWRWDSIFPDRRDYANLVPLPISLRSIFLANLAAILVLALLLAVDVNAASAVLFPLVVSASENTFSFFLHFVGVHAFVVVLASVLSFCTVFAIVGALMIVVPYGSFRRISFYLRASLLACLVAMLSTSFTVPAMLGSLPRTSVRFLPPVWFLGLCQLLRGRATASFASLGYLALFSVLIVVIFGFSIYALSYRRHFVRIPETIGCVSGGRSQQRYLAFSSCRSELLEESVPTCCLSLCDEDIVAERTARPGARWLWRVRYRSRMPVLVYVLKWRQTRIGRRGLTGPSRHSARIELLRDPRTSIRI